MGQNRLCTLALMHINLDIDIDAKRVLKREIGHFVRQNIG